MRGISIPKTHLRPGAEKLIPQLHLMHNGNIYKYNWNISPRRWLNAHKHTRDGDIHSNLCPSRRQNCPLIYYLLCGWAPSSLFINRRACTLLMFESCCLLPISIGKYPEAKYFSNRLQPACTHMQLYLCDKLFVTMISSCSLLIISEFPSTSTKNVRWFIMVIWLTPKSKFINFNDALFSKLK